MRIMSPGPASLSCDRWVLYIDCNPCVRWQCRVAGQLAHAVDDLSVVTGVRIDPGCPRQLGGVVRRGVGHTELAGAGMCCCTVVCARETDRTDL